jgi:xanthine dehydrogenase small subunit
LVWDNNNNNNNNNNESYLLPLYHSVILGFVGIAALTLNAYIRRHTRYTGTKLSCGEGGCGACAVDLSRVDPVSGKVVHISVNSCLRPLVSVDGWAVTTTEGLGSSQTGHHAIQERIANFHGSQCGFCTSGMVMTMYSTLQHNPDATMEQVESRLDGNLCRCTGYRPILDACKSLAVDSDIEDFIGCGSAFQRAATPACNGKSSSSSSSSSSSNDECGKGDCKGVEAEGCGGQCENKRKGDAAARQGPEFPAALGKYDFTRSLSYDSPSSTMPSYVRPRNLEQVFDILAQHRKSGDVKLIVGNTSIGIYKHEQPKVLVDVGNLPELLQITTIDNVGVSFGASVSLSNLEETLDQQAKTLAAELVASFSNLAKHVRRIANVHVRNAGSIAGNLTLAKTKGFLSDLATILLGARATVTMARAGGEQRTLTIEDFLHESQYHAGEIMHSICIPFTKQGVQFYTYKTALRAQNSHAYVNAAFYFDLQHDGVVRDATIAFGGIGRDDEPGTHAVRAVATENSLKDKQLNGDTLARALEILKTELQPQSGDQAFRQRLVTGFFFKAVTAAAGSAVPERLRSAARDVTQRSVSHGRQAYTVSDEHAPVSRAIAKLGATLQASGEAVYTDDMPMHGNAGFGVIAKSDRARGKIVSIDTDAARRMPGVIGVVTAADIKNNNCSAVGAVQPVFAESEVWFHGQPVALVVADSELNATAAARLVKVTYDLEASKPPALTIEQAQREPDVFGTAVKNEVKCGDADAALAAATPERVLKGRVFVGSQLHFAMEPHVAYALPDEEGCMTIYVPHQWPAALQSGVANVLGVPYSKVRAIQRRAGGGFGGKILHSVHTAAIAAVAAHKLKRPVRVTMDRNTDMAMYGGREETDAHYTVAFEPDGRITALSVEALLNAGWTVDLTGFVCNAFSSALSQAYDIRNLKSACGVVLSNLATRTAVRGPGEIGASFAIETIIEHVAHAVGRPADQVRAANFFAADATDRKAPNGTSIEPYTVNELWEQLRHKCDYAAKQRSVDDFNAANRWKKRGLAMTPVRYEVSIWAKDALVNIFADGSVVITHSGTEIGQGMHTKVAQVAAYELGHAINSKTGIDLSFIRFGECDTHITPNGLFTGGSTGSEGAAEASRRCCATIVERLRPIADDLRASKQQNAAAAASDDAQVPSLESIEISWPELIAASRAKNINLSAQDVWSGNGDSALTYHNYGVCASEVEVDVITGEVNIVSSDMLYDCGKSLNPAIDIGQCEGAFMMGVGHMLRERVLTDDNGVLLSDGTWEYKPPGVRDVPHSFNVEFLVNPKFDKGILNSKSSGEPPLVLATSVAMAVRHAVAAARAEVGLTDFFTLNAPITPDVIQAATCPDVEHLTF